MSCAQISIFTVTIYQLLKLSHYLEIDLNFRDERGFPIFETSCYQREPCVKDKKDKMDDKNGLRSESKIKLFQIGF